MERKAGKGGRVGALNTAITYATHGRSSQALRPTRSGTRASDCGACTCSAGLADERLTLGRGPGGPCHRTASAQTPFSLPNHRLRGR